MNALHVSDMDLLDELHDISIEKLISNFHMLENKSDNHVPLNIIAYAIKRKLTINDKKVALKWLQSDYCDLMNKELEVNNIYRYLTTVKAYIIIGEPDTAISLLEKLLVLCYDNKRLIEAVDALILLSIACRRKKLMKESEDSLIKALEIAQEHDFKQPFIDESVELASELGRLSKQQCLGWLINESGILIEK